jgi:putative FmdB family regulatory protein
MPAYSYRCSNSDCRDVRDLTASVEERDAWQGNPCPTCGNGKLKRLFSAPGYLNVGLGDII